MNPPLNPPDTTITFFEYDHMSLTGHPCVLARDPELPDGAWGYGPTRDEALVMLDAIREFHRKNGTYGRISVSVGTTLTVNQTPAAWWKLRYPA